MVGFVAAVGSYLATGQVVPGLLNDMLLMASMIGGSYCAAIDRWKC